MFSAKSSAPLVRERTRGSSNAATSSLLARSPRSTAASAARCADRAAAKSAPPSTAATTAAVPRKIFHVRFSADREWRDVGRAVIQ